MWRAPDFWLRQPGFAARVLSPIGWIYGAITARRMSRAGVRVDAPVICVGNFTAGGAGKTPTVIALAALLTDMGATPFIVSRGYGGASAGPLRVDPASHDAAMVGDEPLEIAAHAPVIVARDRVAGAQMAIATGASVILLDDGLQSPSLHKNLMLAVVDGETWFGNGYCVPAGPLRAPVAAQAQHVHAAIIIGGDGGMPRQHRASLAAPLLHARIEPDAALITSLAGERVLAFAGIGRPEKFFSMLRAHNIDVAAVQAFADHQPFADDALTRLAEQGRRDGLIPVTTMKDYARMGAERARRMLGGRLRVIPVALKFENENAVRALLAPIFRPE